ncbi:MAG: dihydroneopterin aldolase [Alphaproteobacteria bacterium]|nr:dihydroneopterin aldolase [Alphaproteobacteria bacterium]MDE1931704.1 dihydroneopterin aldolase [Alphaproteobacteria bacterium]
MDNRVTAKPPATKPVAETARYKLFVRNLVLAAKIGVHPHEKVRPPRLRVSVELDMEGNPPRHDDLTDALDYERVVAGIRELAVAQHINLVETFADLVARLCLANPRVSGASVTVEKLDVYSNAESVGVTLERRRAE